MKLPFYIVDVFAKEKYAGNQLAVFMNAENLSTTDMKKIAREINFAESTFVTKLNVESNSAEIRIFTPSQEMQFAGHPIIGTSWILMNKIFKNNPKEIELTVKIGAIPVTERNNLVWLKAAQPQFFNTRSKDEFFNFSNLKSADFDLRFPIQEVTTGSAFILVPIATKKALDAIKLDVEKVNTWLDKNCTTEHKALYFFCLEEGNLTSRMLYLQDNQLMEDAATGSASTCLQAFLLHYFSTDLKITNHQGEMMGRPSQIEFDGKVVQDNFDIKIGGKTHFIAQGEWSL